MNQSRKWDDTVEGTSFFPRHRRWDCRTSIIEALREARDPLFPDYERAWYHIGRAQMANSIMFDVGDPLAPAYAGRIEKILRLIECRKVEKAEKEAEQAEEQRCVWARKRRRMPTSS